MKKLAGGAFEWLGSVKKVGWRGIKSQIPSRFINKTTKN